MNMHSIVCEVVMSCALGAICCPSDALLSPTRPSGAVSRGGGNEE